MSRGRMVVIRLVASELSHGALNCYNLFRSLRLTPTILPPAIPAHDELSTFHSNNSTTILISNDTTTASTKPTALFPRATPLQHAMIPSLIPSRLY